MKDKEFRKNKEHRERVQTNRYMADVNNGLNRQQVEEYTRNGWTNEPVDPPSKSVQEIIQSNVFTYFNLVFAVLAVLLIVAGSFRNLTFLPVIIANTCIGIFQEIRAKNTLDKLSVLNAPKAVVVRDGQKWEIPAEELEDIETVGDVIEYLREKGKKVFLDLKFHDIPNTMKSAVKAAIKDNVWMMTIHVSDFEGMRQCAEIAKQEAERLNIEKPIIVGVTVLTSLSNEDLQDIGCNMTTEELAIKRAKLAKKSGIDGVVCSAKEVDKIVEACGKDFVTVCPGIRPQSAAVGDQKRVVTPAQAIQNGAHYMVVGRPITQAENPKQSAIDIVKEIENA